MREESIFGIDMPYRGRLDIKGFSFGQGEDAVCIVGALRGDEVQQMYICSLLVHRLGRLETRGAIVPGKRILVIPCANHISMNVGKRFWTMDNTDINRMFPGYDQGETTQRIAAGIFKAVQGFSYGVQLASFHAAGDFLPHVRVMNAPGPGIDNAKHFGMRYVMTHEPDPFDTTTLNYNWRLWDTDAYSLYAGKTDDIDEESAQEALRGILRFMDSVGAIEYPCHQGYCSTVMDDADLVVAHTVRGGIVKSLVKPGDVISRGEVGAQVIDPFTGTVIDEVRAPAGGVVFFTCKGPLVTEHTLAFMIIARKKQH